MARRRDKRFSPRHPQRDQTTAASVAAAAGGLCRLLFMDQRLARSTPQYLLCLHSCLPSIFDYFIIYDVPQIITISFASSIYIQNLTEIIQVCRGANISKEFIFTTGKYFYLWWIFLIKYIKEKFKISDRLYDIRI